VRYVDGFRDTPAGDAATRGVPLAADDDDDTRHVTKNTTPTASAMKTTAPAAIPIYVARLSAPARRQYKVKAVADPGFLQGGAAAGAFGVPQAPSCPLSLRPLRKFRGSQLQGKNW